jgi:hypothetical protein
MDPAMRVASTLPQPGRDGASNCASPRTGQLCRGEWHAAGNCRNWRRQITMTPVTMPGDPSPALTQVNDRQHCAPVPPHAAVRVAV